MIRRGTHRASPQSWIMATDMLSGPLALFLSSAERISFISFFVMIIEVNLAFVLKLKGGNILVVIKGIHCSAKNELNREAFFAKSVMKILF